MSKMIHFCLSAALAVGLASPALGQSSGRKMQDKKAAEVPTCTKKLGTISIVEPDKNWWSEAGLGSPEAVIKTLVMKSGCFGLVDRSRGLASRNIERAMADSGELQQGSNLGKGQVKAADYFIVPDIIASNNKSGGGGLGGLGGLVGGLTGNRTLGAIGGLAGGLSIKKKEASVSLALVNARTTEQERVSEGYAPKSDLSFGGGYFSGIGFVGGGNSYSNTEIGQVLILAYIDAYTKLVRELGGIPADAAAAAPKAL